jgi:hypothetical protein
MKRALLTIQKGSCFAPIPTGGMDLLVRFPAGHVIPPHFHDSNEHIIVAEGQLRLRQDSGEVQRLSCSSKTRCTFYLSWDGKPESHPAK